MTIDTLVGPQPAEPDMARQHRATQPGEQDMSLTQAEVTKEQLYADFESVVAETEQLLKTIAGAGGDKAGAIKANVEQGLAAAGERLAKIREQSMKHAGAAAQATDEYVHGNPWQSIGVVAGVAAIAGLVAGLLISRR
jgi:ElaB/YqjD/DUF883 family membrane-anchored ribosome-binding protein